MVRTRRSSFVGSPFARAAGGLHTRGHGRQARHRDPQHLERREPLPHALPPASRGRQARCVAGRRIPDGDSAPHARRNVHEAEHDALSQPARDGCGGSAPLLPRRRRRPARRLRQDGPGVADGGDEREPARHSGPGRTDAARQLARRDSRLRHRRLEVLGGAPRGHPRRVFLAGNGRRHRTLVRYVRWMPSA
jgi:hypothetical protein